MPDEHPSPILTDAGFERTIDAVGPATLLVAIEGRMSAAIRRHYSAEDILQEALLHAWRDRAAHTWCGLRAFRAWLLKVIDHRIHDLADRASAKKRGGGRQELVVAATDGETDGLENLVLRVRFERTASPFATPELRGRSDVPSDTRPGVARPRK